LNPFLNNPALHKWQSTNKQTNKPTNQSTSQPHHQPTNQPTNRLLFPLDSLDEGEPLLVELYDKDFAGIEFLGQVGGLRLAAAADQAAAAQNVCCESLRELRGAEGRQRTDEQDIEWCVVVRLSGHHSIGLICRAHASNRQVIMTLGKAIEIASDAATGRAYW